MKSRKALVVVFGDFGHSPRMQNHALEFINRKYETHVAGYSGSKLPSSLSTNIFFHAIPNIALEAKAPQLLRYIAMIARVIIQFLYVIVMSVFVPKADVVLVQTPPAIPALVATKFLSYVWGSVLIYDWHNLGYTILETKKMAPLSVLYKPIELFSIRLADHNIAVTESLAKYLSKAAGGNVHVLRDCPVHKKYNLKLDSRAFKRSMEVRFGWSHDNSIPWLISSTSWTPDENFDKLLEALEILSTDKISLRIIITGKGPLKSVYESKFKKFSDSNIAVALDWFSYEDYINLLLSCDGGICLHESSSGLDFPMKLIDMMGAGLKVACFSYPGIFEILHQSASPDGISLFTTSKELSAILKSYSQGTKSSRYDYSLPDWSQYWCEKMESIVTIT